MKQKTLLITLAILVAVLILGIAYAAITAQQLVVNGTAAATTSDANFDVKFTAVQQSGDVLPVVSIDDSAEGASRKATMTVSGLTTKGQTSTATFTIKNASPAEVAADIEATVTNTNPTWFDVKATIGGTTATTGSLAQNAETTLIVTVTLKDTPATDADVAAAVATIVATVEATAK